MRIAITQFGGIAPLIEPLSLSDFGAQTALNFRVDGGDLRPLIGPAPVAGVTLGRASDGIIRTIYRYRQDTASETISWLQWLGDVSVQRGMIPGDTDERTFWTGDGIPKTGDATLIESGAATRLPGASYQLGLPEPLAPTAAVVGDVPVDANGDPVGTPTYHAYRVRYRNQWGDQGPASPASNIVMVYPTQTVQLIIPTYSTSYNGQLVTTDIFRSVDGSYFWIGETAFNASPFVDLMASASSDMLDSVPYDPPPADLHSLIGLPNGSFAGASGLELRLTPAYKPYAWPDNYRYPVDHKIVGLASVDSSIVVLTNGRPYIASAADPGTVIPLALKSFPQACSSRRSIVEVAGGVIYASPAGLCLVGPGIEPILLTEKLFSKAQWVAMFKPDSIHAYYHDGKYVAFYDNGATQGGFIFDPRDTRAPLVMISTYATAGYVDRLTDSLYLVIGGVLNKWAAGTALTAKFKSKRFMFGWETSWPYMQVLANGYPVTLRLYKDKETNPYFTKVVTSEAPFTIDPERYRFLDVEVESAYSVLGVFHAPSVRELKNG